MPEGGGGSWNARKRELQRELQKSKLLSADTAAYFRRRFPPAPQTTTITKKPKSLQKQKDSNFQHTVHTMLMFTYLHEVLGGPREQ